MVSSYDVFPTLLEYLGIETEPDPQRVGRSYAAFLRGQGLERSEELYFEFAYVRAVRTANLKLIERADGWPSELFDVEADPGERINRIGAPQYRDQVAALRTRLQRFFERAGAPAGGLAIDHGPMLPMDDFGAELTPELREQEERLRAQAGARQ